MKSTIVPEKFWVMRCKTCGGADLGCPNCDGSGLVVTDAGPKWVKMTILLAGSLTLVVAGILVMLR